MVERFNKTLEGLLRAFVNDGHSDWDERLPYVLMAYRSSVNERTGYTPNMMMRNREVTVPLDIQFANPHNAKGFQTECVSNLQFRMEQAHEMAREHIQTDMRRQKKNMIINCFGRNIQMVTRYIFSLRKYTGRSPKFTYCWHGAYEIVEKYSDLNY